MVHRQIPLVGFLGPALLGLAFSTGRFDESLRGEESQSPPSSASARRSPSTTAREIDLRVAAHWQQAGIVPAAQADADTLLRRVMLDLVGRMPTSDERNRWLARKESLEERHGKLIEELLAGPEFSLHWGTVLDEILQGSAAGNVEFVDYLRRRLREHYSWEALFRELLVGPWTGEDAKGATRFLETRVKDLDQLTTDATRAFFGVDISCARCHDHPLVDDWRQEHYYGMASFFNRSSGGKGSISEKLEGEVTFKNRDGEQQTASLMFLSGRKLVEPSAEEVKRLKFSRREQLVQAALEDKSFFSRALVNRLWARLQGRGLVVPLDQLHSANPSSIPGLLEWLAEDFVAAKYDLRHMVGAIASSKAYRLSSHWVGENAPPAEGDFAVRPLSLLTPRQYAFSLLVATGHTKFPPPDPLAERAERLAGSAGVSRIAQYLTAEQTAAKLWSSLDPAHEGQSSTAEALFLSNHPLVQTLVRAEGRSLTAELTLLDGAENIARTAIRRVHCREPSAEEVRDLATWLERQAGDRARACEQLVWALVTSAEFRFQH